ncbi:MAG: sulfite exporter TauE/SafE family protein [Pirellulaceae bacterium]
MSDDDRETFANENGVPEMWMLISAVATASLLGSMHCVGMCGPLAIWASGAGDSAGKKTVAIATFLYHIGRLLTYMIAGLIAGFIGSAIEIGGQWMGYQVMAARVVGAIMIVVGVMKLYQLVRPSAGAGKVVRPSRIGGILVKARPFLFRLPIWARGLTTGMLTTLLPCGWLYLFALIAAGTGSPLMGPVVMFAFWLGTVPALTGLIAGTRLLSKPFGLMVPIAAAILLIVGGGFTASGRGFAGLTSLESLSPPGSDTASLVQQANGASDQPLPCCCEGTQCESAGFDTTVSVDIDSSSPAND